MVDNVFDKIYLVYSQRECDDPYYPPYQTMIGIYKSKEKAIEYARQSYNKLKKYMSNNDCYYVEEHTLDDNVDKQSITPTEKKNETII
jgi:hypothetical protein